MLTIDGSQGEGGGQILRSSLSLSLLTGTEFQIENIRGRRRKPGLLRQHLTAVRAAATISGATVAGAELRSGSLTFRPGQIQAGNYEFAVGSAGSSNLVFQTILPALALAEGPSVIHVRGGTHNPFSPPFDFLVRTLFPLLKKMGIIIEGTLHRAGFYPAGGGHAEFRIIPTSKLRPLSLLERGPLRDGSIAAIVSALAPAIGRREIIYLADDLGWDRSVGKLEMITNSRGPGNALMATVPSDQVTEIFTGFGEPGVSARQIAKQVARETQAYIQADVPVGHHLADQLLLWNAIAGGGTFRTTKPTNHTLTQIAVIKKFLGHTVSCRQTQSSWEIDVSTTRI